MKHEIDFLIALMSKYTTDNEKQSELGEQDAAAPTGGGGGTTYPTVTKWESGVTRGPANQIGLTKWREITKITRGKANTLL